MAFITFNSIYYGFICRISVTFKTIYLYNLKIFRIEFFLMTNNTIFIEIKIHGVPSFFKPIDGAGDCVIRIHKLLFLSVSKGRENITQRHKEYIVDRSAAQ